MPYHYTPGPMPFVPFLQAEMACEHCNVRFLFPRSQEGSRRFCSPDCAKDAQRGQRIPITCRGCGVVFEVKRNRAGAARYHTRACQATAKLRTVAERFWSKVKKSDGCWLWTASLTPGGYGNLGCKRPAPHTHLVHRLSWELNVGPIPAGMQVNHHCDVRTCVRPDHLFLGSQRDNSHDMMAKGRGGGQFKKGRRAFPSRAKLTDEDVVEIRRRYAAGGVLQREIGAQYGISQTMVSYIVLRKAHHHLR